MPLYDYRCNACGHQFELLQGMNEGPPEQCPQCGAGQVKKLVAAPAFTFKGGGWYKDLYGSSGNAKKPADTAAKSEKKPAAKESTPKPKSSDS